MISIIIPAYNVADYIPVTLDSILAQNIAPGSYEVICIDDGSTDKTADVLDQYALSHPFIRVLHKQNGGVSAARNDGIAMAHGDWICFFDGDDFMKPETLSDLETLARKTEADAVIYGYHRYKDGDVTEVNPPRFSKELYTGEEIIRDVMPAFVGLSFADVNNFIAGKKDALYVENPALWRIFVKRSVILENELSFDTSLAVGEDTVFISEYLCCCNRVAVTQNCYYYLVLREGSAIETYERTPFKKLNGKHALNKGRAALQARVKTRTGKDIEDAWAGTIVLSAVEMAFQLTSKNCRAPLKERYSGYLSFATDPYVTKRVADYTPGPGSVAKRIPFLLLKRGCYRTLFAATALLQIAGYRFKR